MAFQVSPGINVSERDLTHVVPNVATTIGAMAGAFQWGPVLERVTLTTENELVKSFGKPNDTTAVYESFFTAANYLSYSNNLILVRTVQASAKNSIVNSAETAIVSPSTNSVVRNTDHYNEPVAFTSEIFVAKYPGVLGNSLKVLAIDSIGWNKKNASGATTYTDATAIKYQKMFWSYFNGSPGTSSDMAKSAGWDGVSESSKPDLKDEMHVMVIDEDGQWTGIAGEVLEVFSYVSKARDAMRIDGSSNYIKNVLANESEYIWLGNAAELVAATTDNAGRVPGSTKAEAATLGFQSFVYTTTQTSEMPGGSLTGGVDGNDIADNDIKPGYLLFENEDVVDITLIMQGGASKLVGKYIIDAIASKRKDCVAFISPSSSLVVARGAVSEGVIANDIVIEKGEISSSNYAVMDSAWKYQYDRYNDAFRYIPMNADTAGLCARTDYTNDAWWSPAGMSRGQIKNIIKLSWDGTKADRDNLYQGGVNPFHSMTGSGVMLWGDKTMQTVPSAFDRINVRRLFIVLEKAIAIAAKAMLFEFNDEFTRAQFINMVAPFLREVQGRRGITDFKVVCDSSNNTGQIIDTNNFVGDIYVKPNRSINYIQLNFIAARSDVSFTEIGA